MGQDDPMGRCTARSKQTGLQCGQRAKTGMTVCHYHGGKAPQAVEAAVERIKQLAEGPAITRLALLIESDNESVALGAVKDALDRAGFKPKERVEQSGEMIIRVEYADTVPAPPTRRPAKNQG